MVTAKAAELRVTGHSATSLPSYLLCFLDSGGSDLVFTLSKQIAVALMYVQFEADFDRFTVRANI